MSVKTNEIISGGHELSDLKGRTIRGGFVAICAQAIRFFLRITSLVFLARLLMPEDFGLVGMVTSVTGILGLIKTAGLSTVTIQRFTISEEQISTLFWLNVAIGTILTILTFAMAPVISAFYHEPRLFWVTIALASGFLFTGDLKNQAILQRQLRYTTLSLIYIVSLSAGVAVGIVMAIAGLGYWALVSMAVVIPVASAIPMWVATGWVPGSPKRNVGIRSMLHFGGTVVEQRRHLSCL
jgi:PST family polysaccharide transporter